MDTVVVVSIRNKVQQKKRKEEKLPLDKNNERLERERNDWKKKKKELTRNVHATRRKRKMDNDENQNV